MGFYVPELDERKTVSVIELSNLREPYTPVHYDYIDGSMSIEPLHVPLRLDDLKLGCFVTVTNNHKFYYKARYLGYGDYGAIEGVRSYCCQVYKDTEYGEISNSFIDFYSNIYDISVYNDYLDRKLANKTCVLCKRVFEDESFKFCPKCGTERIEK
jgi:hypothetical protein